MTPSSADRVDSVVDTIVGAIDSTLTFRNGWSMGVQTEGELRTKIGKILAAERGTLIEISDAARRLLDVTAPIDSSMWAAGFRPVADAINELALVVHGHRDNPPEPKAIRDRDTCARCGGGIGIVGQVVGDRRYHHDCVHRRADGSYLPLPPAPQAYSPTEVAALLAPALRLAEDLDGAWWVRAAADLGRLKASAATARDASVEL